jgi:hypothetical protein
MRTKFGGLLGAVGLLMLMASVTMAAPNGNGNGNGNGGAGNCNGNGNNCQTTAPTSAPTSAPTGTPNVPVSTPGGGGGGSPTYTIDVWKTANPATVPASGGTVVFTVHVKATGTGFFQVVSIDDPLAGCTLGAATEESGNADAKLETNEIWAYSCTVDNVTPGTENTATVHACHNGSACNNANQDASGVGNVTVEEGEAPPNTPAPTDTPAPTGTANPGSPGPGGTPGSTLDLAGQTQASTDTVSDFVAGAGSPRTLMLVISLGMLLASLVLVTPTRPVRARARER